MVLRMVWAGLALIMLLSCSKQTQQTEVDSDSDGKALREQVASLTDSGAFYYSRDTRLALNFFKEAVAVAKQQDNRNIEANSIRNLGAVYRQLGELDSSIYLVNSALDIFKETGSHSGMAMTYNVLGSFSRGNGQYLEAINYYRLSLEERRQYDQRDTLGEAAVITNMGRVHRVIGEYDRALECFIQGLELIGDSNPRRTGNLYVSVGLTYESLQDYVLAEKYYLDALNLFEESDDKLQKIDPLINLGNLYVRNAEYAKAEEFLDEAVAVAIEVGASVKIGLALTARAEVYIYQDKDDTAIRDLHRAIDVFEKNDAKGRLLAPLLQMSRVLNRQGNPQNSLVYSLRGSALGDKIGNNRNQIELLQEALVSYKRLRNWPKAVEISEKLLINKDSLFNEQRAAQVSELQTEFEVEKNELRIRALEKENEAKENQRLFLISVVVFLAIVLAISIIAVFLKNRLARKKEEVNMLNYKNMEIERDKLRSEIEFKERQLASTALHIYKKNESLMEIKSQLKDNLKAKSDTEKAVLRKSIKKIDSSFSLDDDWNQFKVHFEAVYDGFFQRLTADTTNLTPNEIKLCSYLRMQLSNKEIARINNTSIASIMKARYRLRKKLQMKNEDSLDVFIMNV